MFALERIQAQGREPLDTIVIDANLFIWPDFNMQVRTLISVQLYRLASGVANLTS